MTNPLTWQGRDPNSRRSGASAWADIQARTGLGNDYLQRAGQITGYTDATGAADITGEQENRLGEAWAQETGNAYVPWVASSPGGNALPFQAVEVPEAPMVSLARVGRPGTYAPTGFQAPSMAAAMANPGYQFSAQEAVDRTLNSAAAAGMTRGPNARRAVAENILDLAERNYGTVYDREYQQWLAENGLAGDAFDRNLGADVTVTGANNNAALAELEPQLQEWEARILAGDRNADRARLIGTYNTDDQFRREQAAIGNQRIARRDAVDEWWRGTNFDEDRLRYLTQMGL